MAGSAALIVFGIVFTATQVRLDYFDSELTFRGAAHDDLVRVLESRAVQDGLRCGPLTVPNHKLVPDSRWILDAPESRVIPRADRDARKPARGVALVVVSRFAVFKHAWSNDHATRRSSSRRRPGWRRVVSGDFYAAYARC